MVERHHCSWLTCLSLFLVLVEGSRRECSRHSTDVVMPQSSSEGLAHAADSGDPALTDQQLTATDARKAIADTDARQDGCGMARQAAPDFISWVKVQTSVLSYDTRLLRVTGNTLTLYEKAADRTVCTSELRGPMLVIELNQKARVYAKTAGVELTVPGDMIARGNVDEADTEYRCIAGGTCVEVEFKFIPKRASDGTCKKGPCEQKWWAIGNALQNAKNTYMPHFAIHWLDQMHNLLPYGTMATSKGPYYTPAAFYQITSLGIGAKYTTASGFKADAQLTDIFQDGEILSQGTTYLWLITMEGSFRWAQERTVQRRICHGDLNALGFKTNALGETNLARGTARAGGELNYRDVYSTNGSMVGQGWVIDDRTSFQGSRTVSGGRDALALAKAIMGTTVGTGRLAHDPDLLLKAATYMRDVLDLNLLDVYARSDISKKVYLQDKYPEDFKDKLADETKEVLERVPYIRVMNDAGDFFQPVVA